MAFFGAYLHLLVPGLVDPCFLVTNASIALWVWLMGLAHEQWCGWIPPCGLFLRTRARIIYFRVSWIFAQSRLLLFVLTLLPHPLLLPPRRFSSPHSLYPHPLSARCLTFVVPPSGFPHAELEQENRPHVLIEYLSVSLHSVTS